MLKQYHLKVKLDVVKNGLMPYSTSTPLKSENIVRSFNSEILIIHSKKTIKLNTNLRLTLLFFKFENRIKAKVHGKTKKLQSFMHFTELDGELDLSGADCLMRAARFIQTYYEEFTPYLQVAENNEDNEKVGFQFGIYKNGYKIENQLFYIMISKKTGAILTFAAPTVSIKAIEQFNPQQVKPLPALLDLTQLTVKAKWQGMQLVYTIRTVDGEFIRDIHAETGEVLGG